MKVEYEKLTSTHTTCCNAANLLATNTTDPLVAEALNVSIQQLIEGWQKLENQLAEANDKYQNALDKAKEFERCHAEISSWLSKMLDKLKNLDPCAAQVKLINVQISEANVCF